MAVAVVGGASGALAQQPPIKIGMSMPQTGGLAGGGKASLLGIEIWRDDINAKGGLLGRKVELVVYDDKSSASETPAIYAKLVDVDKVDLLFAPYATVPTAPIMPFVKQRGLLLMGNFSFQVNSKVGHDMWFNNAPWGPADSWAASFLDLAQKAGGKTMALLSADQEFAQNLALTARDVAKKRNIPVVFDQNYPPNTVEFASIIRALKAAKPDIVYVASYPPDSAGILRAVNEIGIGDDVKIFGGGMVGLQFAAVMSNLGSLLNGVVNYNTWLVKNGYMALKQGTSTGGKTLEDLFDKGELGEFFRYVDWSRTKAYAMGLGNIYVNLMGREPQGSVVPGREYEEVRTAMRHPLIVDGRNLLEPAAVRAAGFAYEGIGRPASPLEGLPEADEQPDRASSRS